MREILESLKQENNFRVIPSLAHNDIYVRKNNKDLLNLASNDYLGLSLDPSLKEQFLDEFLSKHKNASLFSSSSSRILSGNFEVYEEFEEFLSQIFAPKKALLFNSGYHLNVSCIQALGRLPNVMFVLDWFIHASVIDGVRLSGAKFKRFKHNDLADLENLLATYASKFENLIIVSDGLFSMDGDCVHLGQIIALKKKYKNILIYLDEAHSIGAIGNGFGIAKTLGLENEIDFLVLTFGKAISSVGACMLCMSDFREFFINFARALIYSTALPPINVAFSYFVFTRLESFNKKRENLKNLSIHFRENLANLGFEILGKHYIISIICGENEATLALARKLEEQGVFAPAIRYPTVPKNTARIRFSLHSALGLENLDFILGALK